MNPRNTRHETEQIIRSTPAAPVTRTRTGSFAISTTIKGVEARKIIAEGQRGSDMRLDLDEKRRGDDRIFIEEKCGYKRIGWTDMLEVSITVKGDSAVRQVVIDHHDGWTAEISSVVRYGVNVLKILYYKYS